jgi:hypothetical protein
MKHIFRTTAGYWVKQDGFGLFCALAGGALLYYLDQKWVAVVLWLIAALCFREVYRLLRARLEIDEQSITVVGSGSPIRIKWSEIAFTKLVEGHKGNMRILSLLVRNAQEQEFFIRLDHLDHKRIWELAQQYTPPTALTPEAQYNTAEYQAWLIEQKRYLDSVKTPLAVSDSWIVRGSGWLLLLMSMLFIYVFASEGPWIGSVFWVGFACLGIYCALITGRSEADKAGVTRKLPLGHYRILWDEIRFVEFDMFGSLVFYGDDKYLAITGPGYWAGKEKDEMRRFVQAQIDLRKLEMKAINMNFKFARNTKIK